MAEPAPDGAPGPAPAKPPATLETLVTGPRPAYALLDSGDGRKYERCGPYRFIRPEPQALWAPQQPQWQADGVFEGHADDDGRGRWALGPHVPASWPIELFGRKIHAECTPFRHFAFFPDMEPHWQRITALPPGKKLLNLFGYTGMATLVAASRDLEVVHVDASKKAIGKARANAVLSGLDGKRIRWITDDARRFVARERRRGHRYDAILLDPPKFGRGPNGEPWNLYSDLAALVADCVALLDHDSSFLVVTTYAVRLSAIALGRLVHSLAARLPGTVQAGEMTLMEEGRGLLLPTAIFASWNNSVP